MIRTLYTLVRILELLLWYTNPKHNIWRNAMIFYHRDHFLLTKAIRWLCFFLAFMGGSVSLQICDLIMHCLVSYKYQLTRQTEHVKCEAIVSMTSTLLTSICSC